MHEFRVLGNGVSSHFCLFSCMQKLEVFVKIAVCENSCLMVSKRSCYAGSICINLIKLVIKVMILYHISKGYNKIYITYINYLRI